MKLAGLSSKEEGICIAAVVKPSEGWGAAAKLVPQSPQNRLSGGFTAPQ
jgi:hypothetical protein